MSISFSNCLIDIGSQRQSAQALLSDHDEKTLNNGFMIDYFYTVCSKKQGRRRGKRGGIIPFLVDFIVAVIIVNGIGLTSTFWFDRRDDTQAPQQRPCGLLLLLPTTYVRITTTLLFWSNDSDRTIGRLSMIENAHHHHPASSFILFRDAQRQQQQRNDDRVVRGRVVYNKTVLFNDTRAVSTITTTPTAYAAIFCSSFTT